MKKDIQDEFERAVIVDDTSSVMRFLRDGADVNAKGGNGWTPMFIAAYHGSKQVAELLIAKGADVHAADFNGETALCVATIKGSKDVVELLIAKGADVNGRGNHGMMPLHQAAHWGHKEVAELLIAKGADMNAKDKTTQGCTPLHTAAELGNRLVAELLIAKGADMNATDENGWTALHKAIVSGYEEVAKLLIDKGADVKAKNIEGQTPIDIAVREGLKDMAKLLKKHGAKKTPKPKHAKDDSTPLRDIDRKNRQSLLHIAAASNQLRIAKKVLRRGVIKKLLRKSTEIDAQNIWGATPLHLAVSNDNYQMARLLLRYGANAAIKNDSGLTPAGLARALGRERFVDLLQR